MQFSEKQPLESSLHDCSNLIYNQIRKIPKNLAFITRPRKGFVVLRFPESIKSIINTTCSFALPVIGLILHPLFSQCLHPFIGMFEKELIPVAKPGLVIVFRILDPILCASSKTFRIPGTHPAFAGEYRFCSSKIVLLFGV